MKTYFHFQPLIAIAIFIFVMAFAPGCRQRPDNISKKLIAKQANQELYQISENETYVPIRVGLYEADVEERAQLRQLAAAGLITYKVTRYAWWEKSKVDVKKAFTVTKSLYNIWTYNDTEYRTVKSDYYEFFDHYVVEIALTKQGQKLVGPDVPEERPEFIDKDLEWDYEDPAQYIWNKKDLSENWPVIENPFIEKTSAPKNTSSNKDSGTQSKKEQKPAAPEKITRIDSLQYQAYNLLSFKYKYVYLFAYETKVDKVRNIQIYESEGYPKCKAEVILISKKVTDVGRIFKQAQEGMKRMENVELDYYIDKGWIMKPLLPEPFTEFLDE